MTTTILTWNIQCGKGVDEVVSLERIAGVAREFGDADILCFQEVARHDPELDGGRGEDQAQTLATLFPEHEMLFGPALNRGVGTGTARARFGNMILCRLPVLQTFSHILPRPRPSSPCKHMQRQALEIVVALESGPVRVTTTHLEYHSESQRLAQTQRLKQIQQQATALSDYGESAPPDGPYAAFACPERSIVCGDFNAVPDDACYRAMTASTAYPAHLDAWTLVHADQPHAPTCGIFDHEQWQDGAHCRDYFFVTSELATLVQDVSVQQETSASDHQPVLVTLASQPE